MKRAVRAVLRLIAAGLILFGGLQIGLELTRHRLQKTDFSFWSCAMGAALAALGIFLIAASASLAEQLTDDFED